MCVNVTRPQRVLTRMVFRGNNVVERVYHSQDKVADGVNATAYPIEYLHSINPPGMPPHELTLKVGQPILLLRNMDPKASLCNGTRLIVRALNQRYINAEILIRDFEG